MFDNVYTVTVHLQAASYYIWPENHLQHSFFEHLFNLYCHDFKQTLKQNMHYNSLNMQKKKRNKFGCEPGIEDAPSTIRKS